MRATSSLRRRAAGNGGTLALSLVLAFTLLGLLLGATVAAAEVVGSASGRYDTVVLRDLGKGTAAVVSMVAADGAFTPRELWRGEAGAYNARKAKFVAGDVNGDGFGDGIALYDLGHSRARLDVFLSDGQHAVQSIAWTSKAGAFSWSRAKLTVGDVNRDGLDDVIVLYDRGNGAAALYRFISDGKKFTMSTGWSAGRGTFWCSRAQLAAGDVTGDGRDDALVLYGRTAATSSLYVFAATETKFTKRTFWEGAYAAGRAKLAAGDADSDGLSDVICLYRKPDKTGRLDVFRSTGKAFERATWYDGGALPGADCSFAAGDVTGDGRADAVIVKRTGATTCSVTTCVSTRAAYEPQVWWTGAWAYGTVRLGVTPSSGTVVSDDAKVLDSISLKALRQVSGDMTTLTFAAETAQLGQLKPGDVLLTAPSATFPDGICRKVLSVADQGGKPVVTTAQAALTDVIDQGEVAFSQRISGADLSQEYVTQPGVRLSREPRPSGPLPWPSWAGSDDGFGFSLATKVFDPVTGLALAEVKGSVWLSTEAYVDIDLKPWGVESASYTQTLSTTTDLTVSLMASGKKEAKRVIYQQTMGVITIMVGPAPVFVTPVFTVYVGAKGELSAGVTGGVTMTSDISVGISYDDDRDEHWVPTKSFEKTITWSPPQVFGKVTLRGFAGAGLAFKFYGVAGPEAQLEPYLQLDASTLTNPWWTLKAGVDAKLGFKVEVLGATIMEHSVTIPLFCEPLDQAGSGGDPGGGAYQLPSIRGAILDAASSAPVSGATVEVRSGAPPGGSAVFTTYAAADGGYVFFGLMPGQYTVAAWDEGYADNNRAVTVVAGSTTEGQDVRLTADENQGVKGRVVTFPGGGPLSGADVELRVGGIPVWCSPEGSIDSAADGSFEFLGLEPGPYWLTADKEGYFGDRIELTVLAGRLTTGQDIRMVPYASQGLTGTVISSLNGQPIAGATMHLHYGADSPASDWTKATTTAVDGSYAFTGVNVTDSGGLYTVTAAKTGYVDGARNSTVASARVTTGQDLQLAPVGLDGAARSVEEDDFIRYDAGAALADGWGDPLTGMTYEFWFKAATGFPGHIAMVTYRYGNWPDDWINNHCVVDLALMAEGGNIVFGINENDGGGPGDGTWHYLVSDTVPEPGRWYHIAAQCGTQGMKLFIDGRREAADPYAGIPEVDRADGTLTGGWFTLGDYDNAHGGPASLSALGAYRQLRVSYVQRYTEDFTPPDMAVADDDTALLDHLVGGTVGDNFGFVWVP